MTHDDVDRLVRAADPYDDKAVHDLRGADQALLEEIMTAAPELTDELERRRARRRRLTRALVAAAVLAVGVAVGVPALIDDSGQEPAGKGHVVQAGGQDTIVYTAAAIKVAESNPRLLIDEPGWKATTVYGFAKDEGTINFTKGDRQVEMNWYAAAQYDGYYEDRNEVSDREPITVDGQPGSRVVYTAGDVAAMLEPEGSTFAEIRSSGFDSTADVLKTFAAIKHVDVDTWLAALPPEIVTPGKTAEIVDEILADVPLPPGFDKTALTDLGVNSRYHVGAAVIDGVVCGWLDDWLRADDVGDVAGQRKAVGALRSAHSWKILAEMDAPDAGYSEGPWSLADEIAVGQDPMRYIESFNCLRAR
jgi:hypothetical protein